MRINISQPLGIAGRGDVLVPNPEQWGSGDRVFIASDNGAVAKALYQEIGGHDGSRVFGQPQFDEALEAAYTAAGVAKCNLALVVLHKGGCFVASAGHSRVMVLHVESREVEHDTRNQLLDIYNSKAKVENVAHIESGDYILLSSVEDIDHGAVKRILWNSEKSDEEKAQLLAGVAGSAKTRDPNRSAAMALLHVSQASGSAGGGLGFKPKHLAWTAGVLAVAGVAAWIVTANPFAGVDLGSEDDALVEADSLVTDQAPHDVEVSYVAPPVDSIELKARQDSLAKAAAQAAKLKAEKAKAEELKRQQEEQAAAEHDIKVVHSEPASAPAEAPETAPQEPAE